MADFTEQQIRDFMVNPVFQAWLDSMNQATIREWQNGATVEVRERAWHMNQAYATLPRFCMKHLAEGKPKKQLPEY